MWTPAPRSAEAQALYDAAEADRAARPERYSLSAQAVIAAATAKSGPAEGDDGDWRPGLDAYVTAAQEEGRLNALGVRNMISAATGRLRARWAIAKAFQRAPELKAQTIDRPIFVLGGWRTGTTLLQRLLSAAPALRAAYPSELSAPWRCVGLDAAQHEAFLDAGEAAHGRLHTLNPAMQAIHPSGGRLAEECVLAMGTDLRNWGFTSTLRCPGYARWLLSQDLSGAYRRHADILRLLQDESGRRWVLKAPAHTAELPSLLAAFPNAGIVHLHRDVVQTVTSGASLFAVFRSTYSDAVDPVDVGRYQLDMTATWFERAMDARAARPGAAVFDVAFADLVADPVGTARAICERFDVAWSEATDAACRLQLGRLREQHGAHRYAPEDFGLDPDEIRERFARYCEAFPFR
jgi:hypothetical protein